MIDLNPKQKLLIQWYILLLYMANEDPKGDLKTTLFLTCGELVRLNFPME